MSSPPTFGSLSGLVAGPAAPPPPSRESAYLKQAEGNLYQARKRRLDALSDPVTKDAIHRATARLTELAHPGRDYIVIRSELIYGRRLRPAPCMDGYDSRIIPPPLTRVLRGKNQYAIALYLTRLFGRQMEVARAAADNQAPPPQRRRRSSVYNSATEYSEASLIGIPGHDRHSQRRIFNRALLALQAAELVDLGGGPQRYVNYILKREDGSGYDYTIPEGEPGTPQHLCLPTEFFTAGWPLILTPSELATFLAICHYSDRKLPEKRDSDTPQRIYLAKSVRDDYLGLSDEAYESIHQLAEFGLIAVYDPVEGRRRGRISPTLTGGKRPEPYLLTPTVLGGFPSHERAFDLDVFARTAWDTVVDRLRGPLPRYAVWAGTSRKKDDENAKAAHAGAPPAS